MENLIREICDLKWIMTAMHDNQIPDFNAVDGFLHAAWQSNFDRDSETSMFMHKKTRKQTAACQKELV